MRVVLDTNIIVSSALSPKGISTRVLDLAREGMFDLVTSEAVLAEYRETLLEKKIQTRHKLTTSEIIKMLGILREISLLVVPDFTLDVVKDDPDDNKFVECAVAGDAAIIVTRDPDLLTIGSYQGIHIVRPHVFVQLLLEERKRAA